MRSMTNEYTIGFVTPAFLGDSEQKGAWRTPPFKTLIRRWWRVVIGPLYDYDYRKLREREGVLFGHTCLEIPGCKGAKWAMKSQVQIRLEEWKSGTLGSWPLGERKVFHPEVGNGGRKIGAHLYLGYGPLEFKKGTRLRMRDSIDHGEIMTLALIFPPKYESELIQALQLLSWLGTLGGRSRNGWGSIFVKGHNLLSHSELSADNKLLQSVSRNLSECINRRLDWAHTLGKDERGLLIWKTRGYKSWAEAMNALAQIKIEFRTAFSFKKNKDARAPYIDERHVLAYPVTNHAIMGWSQVDRRGKLRQTERLANQIHFKVLQTSWGYVGLIYHLPCALPQELLKKLSPKEAREIQKKELKIWCKVHEILDHNKSISRL